MFLAVKTTTYTDSTISVNLDLLYLYGQPGWHVDKLQQPYPTSFQGSEAANI